MILGPNHAITGEAVYVAVSLSCILIEKGYVWLGLFHINIYNCNSVQTSVFTTVWTVRNSLKYSRDWELAPMNCFKPYALTLTLKMLFHLSETYFYHWFKILNQIFLSVPAYTELIVGPHILLFRFRFSHIYHILMIGYFYSLIYLFKGLSYLKINYFFYLFPVISILLFLILQIFNSFQ